MEKDNLPERERERACLRRQGSVVAFSPCNCWDSNPALACGLSLLTAHLAILWAPSRLSGLCKESWSHYNQLCVGADVPTNCSSLILIQTQFFSSAGLGKEDCIFLRTEIYTWLQMSVRKQAEVNTLAFPPRVERRKKERKREKREREEGSKQEAKQRKKE